MCESLWTLDRHQEGPRADIFQALPKFDSNTHDFLYIRKDWNIFLNGLKITQVTFILPHSHSSLRRYKTQKGYVGNFEFVEHLLWSIGHLLSHICFNKHNKA